MSESYATPGGVESAIKHAAKNAALIDRSVDTGKRIQMEYFNRFLSRVFSESEESEWVLKGGTSILARIPSTRSTRDIDLYHRGYTLDESLSDLKRLASMDLKDHFRFVYLSHTASIGNENQPYTEGYKVKFEIYLGVNSKSTLSVDLAVGTGITGDIVIQEPVAKLALPKLLTAPYRLYPVVDQIADKVCATITEFNGVASTREKDLVDLVVLAKTQQIDGKQLRIAIETEARRRQMEPISHFEVPPTWGQGYIKLSKPVTHCAKYRSVQLAVDLVKSLVDPALANQADGSSWSFRESRWS